MIEKGRKIITAIESFPTIQQLATRLDPLSTLLEQQKKIRSVNQAHHCIASETSQFSTLNGPLQGVGMIHKDIFQLEQHMPGLGVNTGYAEAKVTRARAITKLHEAGASILGTAVMAPYACGATSQNSSFPRCLNPLDPHWMVGGSSSGSAVAVASGMTPVSLGTDTSGSVRIPAASCAILGLKTTPGVISTEGVMTLSPTLDTVGILGKHVQDIQLILNILTEVPLQDIAPQQNIAYWIPEQLLNQTIFNGLTQFISTRFPKADQINFTDFEIYRKATELIFSYELNQQFSNRLDDPTITKTIRSICKRAQYISPEQYLEHIKSLTEHRQQFIDQYLRDYDLIIIPCFSCSLPDWQEVEIGHPQFHQEKLMGLFHLMGFINYLGLPAISIPIGLDADHRPLSVQVISRPLMEKNLLEFTQQILA